MKQIKGRFVLIISGLLILLAPMTASAAIPNPGPSSGSVGVQGTISSPPPKTGATIVQPANGQTFTQTPITVSGACPSGLLVKVFSNNVFVGSAVCKNGSFSIKSDLFSGRNDLVARVYDALGQGGPDSNVVTVTFNDAQFLQFGTRVQLSSNYAEIGANPGDKLVWPIILSGGKGPYAISVDWGDGSPSELLSQPTVGSFNISHVYNAAGQYNVIVKATDSNGTSAYLQLVGIGNGQATQTKGAGNSTTVVKTEVVWWPIAVMIPLILLSFWLGKRHELYVLRRNIEENRNRQL